jgi:hypothetical protein
MPESVGLIVGSRYGPPDNELPAVIDMASSWIGDGVAIAVPSCLVYSNGVLLTAIGRTRAQRSGDIHEAARLVRDGLEGRPDAQLFRLTVNGGRASLMGGQHHDYGWEHRLWKSFGEAGAVEGLRIGLEWRDAGIGCNEHQIGGETVSNAVARVITLWPLATTSEV